MEQKKYVFSNVDNLANYLFSEFGNLTPLKLQKGLYFLFAYYGAMYGRGKQEIGESEQSTNFPAELFEAEFEAWTYGPVIRDVYQKNKNEEYTSMAIDESHDVNVLPEVRLFIDEMFGQINSISDFSLVDRSHEDEAWSKAYHEHGQSSVMSNEDLINEYREKYVR